MNSEGTLTHAGRAGWRLFTHEALASTNDSARQLSAWNAVCARRQTSGRGRFGRSFVSDEGGLWISAVLPAGKEAGRWTGFSLMAGNHLLRMLHCLQIPQARLRWPNDLMADEKKLAGILIEQVAGETLIVGLGLNVRNTPWREMPELTATTTRLADLLPEPPDLLDLATLVLDALADAHAAMLAGGLTAALEEFNAHHEARRITIALLEGKTRAGVFTGLDAMGNLRLTDSEGVEQIIDHSRVERLQEIAALQPSKATPPLPVVREGPPPASA
ncbi:MAG: biotin--[acetyl-CoA-carboxylase] ligase [Verrucomicrobiota bacterium]